MDCGRKHTQIRLLRLSKRSGRMRRRQDLRSALADIVKRALPPIRFKALCRHSGRNECKPWADSTMLLQGLMLRLSCSCPMRGLDKNCWPQGNSLPAVPEPERSDVGHGQLPLAFRRL